MEYDDNENDDNDGVGTRRGAFPHGAFPHDESKTVIDETDEFDLDIPDFLDADPELQNNTSAQKNDDLLNKFKVKKTEDGKLHSDYTTNDDYIDESKMGNEGKSVLDMMKEIL